ncbi:MAG: NAD(P)-dependent oxidoreductase [Thermoguttaceae bacterium]
MIDCTANLPSVSPGTHRLGWIGTGVMGSSMCENLLRAGFSATVYNRTKSKAEKLLAKGARWAASPRAVAEQSDVIFSIVGYPADVREVILGSDGALAGCREGAILVDMTTSEPSLALEIAGAALKRGAISLDAPVSGGDVGAREARLTIMIGGDARAVAALQPCWQAMGKTIVHQGGPGAGQQTKMVNQALIASCMVGVCESLLYGYKAGLDLEKVLQSVGGGGASSWSLVNYGPRILKGDYAPGFFVEHFLKDLGIILAESRRMNLIMPCVALAEQLYRCAQAQGHGRDGTQSLILALAEMTGIEWKSRFTAPAGAGSRS